MTVINKTLNSSYGFKAPAISGDADKKTEVVFPTHAVMQLGELDSETEIAIERAVTVVFATLTGDVVIDASLSSDLKPGDMVLLHATASGDTRTLTLGASLGGAEVDIEADVTQALVLLYNGSGFTPITAATPGADGEDGEDGADGKSAYEIWLDEGNSGDEAAFLASLKGEDGEDGADAVIEDNSVVPAKLQKGTDDLKTYTLKSVLGVVQWVEDTVE